ncbi:MAG: 4Fe-4S dicluster domain-containing protein [Faecalibacterium sp.]
MGFFTKTAMDALMKTTHPEVNRRQCWNLHPHRTACTACKDICPYGEEIFTRPSLIKEWDACVDCGLCVSACRSRCIAPSPEQVQRDTSCADTDNDTIWIGCEKSARKNTVVRACVASLSWEALAYLALNKKLVLDLTPCGECENDACAAQLRSELNRLVEFFGPELFQARFTLAYQAEDAPYQVKNLSRREMFNYMSSSSREGTKHLLRMLPGLRSEDSEWGSALDFRILLNQRMKQLKAAYGENPLRFGVYLPAFTDKCFGCDRCVKACRSGALQLEDLPDGQTRAVITPWKCSECGVCVAACSNHGLDGLKLRQLTSLGPVSVYKFRKTVCKDCGKPISPNAPDGVCSVCRIKARTKKRQEEAIARVQKRNAERAAEQAAQEAARSLATETAETAAKGQA